MIGLGFLSIKRFSVLAWGVFFVVGMAVGAGHVWAFQKSEGTADRDDAGVVQTDRSQSGQENNVGKQTPEVSETTGGKDQLLPSPREICDRSILKRGGYEILSSIEKSKYVWEADGLKIHTWSKKNCTRVEYHYETQGIFSRVANDTFTWQEWQGTSSPVLGKARESLLERAKTDQPDAWLRWAKNAKTVGIKNVDGRKMYHVHYTDRDEQLVDRFYDVETGLLRKIVQREFDRYDEGEQTTRTLSDYKAFGEILFPTISKVEAKESDITYKLIDLKINLQIADDLFSVPENIKRAQSTDKEIAEEGPGDVDEESE